MALIPWLMKVSWVQSIVNQALDLGFVIDVAVAGDVHDDLVDGATREGERCAVGVVRGDRRGVIVADVDGYALRSRLIVASGRIEVLVLRMSGGGHRLSLSDRSRWGGGGRGLGAGSVGPRRGRPVHVGRSVGRRGRR